MKINKLFHWLYAGLMLLPLFGVLFTSLYVSFNPNAKDSYYGETINDKEYIHTNYSDLVIGETYQINPINIGTQVSEMGSSSYKININNVKAVNFTDNYNLSNAVAFSVYSVTNGYTYVNLVDSNNQNILSISSSTNYIIQYQLVSKNFLGSSITLFNLLNNNKVIFNRYSYLDNAFTYSVNQINENSLYSWAQSSFLVAPIAYITAIFGLASTSPIVTLLSYWLTISIVWLCFDLIMYIPLLVHRWIDKGILE